MRARILAILLYICSTSPGCGAVDRTSDGAGTCSDAVQNGRESDVDCGASCPNRYAQVQRCAQADDCQSSLCVAGLCSAPSCSDNVKNGSETDVDCGGSCAPCAPGGNCGRDGDCQFGCG